MKKNLMNLFAALFIVAIALPSCKKDGALNCTAKISTVSDAANVYGTDDSDANCETYKSALQEAINDCPTYTVGYQDTLDDLPCN